GDLDIEGNNKILTSTTSASGIKTSTYTLTVSNIREYSGFEDAITVQEGGRLEVENVTFTNNKGNAVIMSSGTVTLSSVTFSGNGADIDVANDGELTISGEGAVLEKGINGEGKTEIGSGATLENGAGSEISQSSITVAGILINNNSNANAIEVTDQLEVVNGGEITSSASAISAANGIVNEGTVRFTGGENTNAITGVNGEVIIEGVVTNSAVVEQKGVIISAGNSLETSADNIITSGEIVNAGTLIYTGGTNNNVISGAGELNVGGDLINKKNISQSTISINSGMFTNEDSGMINVGTEINIGVTAGLTTNASNINPVGTITINNEGELIFTGGSNNNNISGSGNLTIDGAVTNIAGKTISQSTITVNAGKELIVEDVTDVTTSGEGIVNEGSVTFRSGTNTNNVKGEGDIKIEGEVANVGEIEQGKVEVASGKLTNEAGIVAEEVENKAEIANSGVVTSTGVINRGVITNSGEVSTTNITNEADATIGNSGTINVANEIANSGAINNEVLGNITAEAVTNSGEITNAGDVRATGITNEANGEVTNSGVITTTGVINRGAITNSGEVSTTNITNEADATIGNSGTINVANEIVNSGAINNETLGDITAESITSSGSITNAGTITATNILNDEGAQIDNSGTISVTGLTNEGEIENEGMIESTNTVVNRGTITSNADNMNVLGIANSGTYNVTGGTVSYRITGDGANKGTINIRESEVTISSNVSNNTINLGTTLKVVEDSYLEGTTTLVIEDGAILITDNGSANDIAATVNIAEGAKWRYELDVDLEDITEIDEKDYGKADRLNVGEVGAGSEATIGSIHINKDKMTKTTVIISTGNINANVAGNIHIYTTNLKYKVESRVEGGNTVLDIVADGYGGLAGAVYDGAGSYSITEYVDYLTEWIEEGGKTYDKLSGDLDIEGNNKILTSTTSASGIKTSTYTLTVSNI
ncbi:MAG: hypothetical protein J5725_09940, partial [Bacteroidales bacterium]|nr:hypothetical protein [Bacteroidales bacterium]